MDRETFWQHIDAARLRNPDVHALGLRMQLELLSLSDLTTFRDYFDELFDAAYRWDLWGAAYLIEGGCSDDGFIDFRYGLIALGRRTFDGALSNPDSLIHVEDAIPNEAFGGVSTQLIEKLGGDPYARYASGPTNPHGAEWDFDDSSEMKKRLPRLWSRYGR